MLWLEDRVVSALAGEDDHRTDGAISRYVASTLAAVARHSQVAGRRVAFAGSLAVIGAGAFWFVQRVLFPGGNL